MGRYKAKAIRLYSEDTVGVKPASPTNIVIKTSTGFDMKEDPKTETLVCVGAGGEASAELYGASTFGGDIPLALTGELMPFIANFLIGEATKTDATADTWAGTTAFAKGDIVNHSDGTHSLYCQEAGTSDATEPSMTGKNEFDEVVDATITWIVRPKLQKYIGQRQECMQTFGIELQLQDSQCVSGAGADVFFRYNGCYLGVTEFGKSGGDISLQTSLSLKAVSAQNSIESGDTAYEAQGGTDVILNKEFMQQCDLKMYLDGAVLKDTSEFKITTDRQLTEEPGVSCDSIVSPGTIQNTGTAKFLFGVDEFKRSENRTTHELKLVYARKGDTATITYPMVQFGKVTPTVETDKFVMMSPTITAIGDDTTPSVKYEIISGLQGL